MYCQISIVLLEDYLLLMYLVFSLCWVEETVGVGTADKRLGKLAHSRQTWSGEWMSSIVAGVSNRRTAMSGIMKNHLSVIGVCLIEFGKDRVNQELCHLLKNTLSPICYCNHNMCRTSMVKSRPVSISRNLLHDSITANLFNVKWKWFEFLVLEIVTLQHFGDWLLFMIKCCPDDGDILLSCVPR